MSEFQSWRDFWEFRRSIIRERRHIRTRQVENFIDTVRLTSEKRLVDIKVNSIWSRAQLGNDYREVGSDDAAIEIECAFKRDRMKPIADKAGDGRVNSRGIPCLYLASQEKTAIAETRPWVGAFVSVAQFRITKNLKIVDCSVGYNKSPIFLDEPNSEDRTDAVWATIDKAFAEPVGPNDNALSYVPTQILAELFKAEGYDGIGYKSSCCSTGFNLALFDCDSANLVNCGLKKISAIELSYKDADQTYFIKDA